MLESVGLFDNEPSEVNAYLKNPSGYISAMKKAGDAHARYTLQKVLEIIDNRCETFQDCLSWALLKFEDYFDSQVKQLTCAHPENAKTSSGDPFWSASKHFPSPLEFSVGDASHIDYAWIAAKLRAGTFGIPIPDWVSNRENFVTELKNLIITKLQPLKDAKTVIDENESSISTSSTDDAAQISELALKLERCQKDLPTAYKLNVVQFEKGNILCNFRLMRLIAYLANMKAQTYGIPGVDKELIGVVLNEPAIVHSDTMVTCLACVEIYEAILGDHSKKAFGEIFSNPAFPRFSIDGALGGNTAWTYKELTPNDKEGTNRLTLPVPECRKAFLKMNPRPDALGARPTKIKVYFGKTEHEWKIKKYPSTGGYTVTTGWLRFVNAHAEDIQTGHTLVLSRGANWELDEFQAEILKGPPSTDLDLE